MRKKCKPILTISNYHFVVFCEEQYDDTYKAYAHTDADGNVLPVTYFPMYEGSVVNNRMRSLSGLTPTASMTDEQETTAAKQNGDRWDKQSFSEINLMCSLWEKVHREVDSARQKELQICSQDGYSTLFREC